MGNGTSEGILSPDSWNVLKSCSRVKHSGSFELEHVNESQASAPGGGDATRPLSRSPIVSPQIARSYQDEGRD